MRRSLPRWLPYIAPLFVFLILTQVETRFGASMYPLLYTAKIVIVGAIAAIGLRRGAYPELKFEWRRLQDAVMIGLILCGAWILVDTYTPHFRFLGTRSAYDPWQHLHSAVSVYAFVAVRMIGLVALVPVIEELFFRSFLLRFAISPGNFESVPLGKFDFASCVFAVMVMAAGHPEWLAAAVFSLAMNVVIYRTKSLFACVAAHAITNLALGAYVIATHAWRYW